MTQDLHTVANKVALAVEIEEARAVEFLAMADQAPGSLIADHLRIMAHERRIRGLELQIRLAGLMAVLDTAREQSASRVVHRPRRTGLYAAQT